jgi:AcrR family transcriptional regulator
VAQKIEYTPTTIYLYFKDKDELCAAVCEETFGGLLKALERAERKYSDPLEQLRAGCRAYIEFGLAHPDQYRVSFMLRVHRQPTPEEMQNMPNTAGGKAYNSLRAGVETCIAQGKFRAADADAVSQALWAAIHGITSLLIVHPFFPWAGKNRLIDLVVDSMIEGLKK